MTINYQIMKKLFETSYVYAILIFIGFYNYYSFYNQFDINIASYLSIGELLLSFLPLSTYILGFLGILFIYFIGAVVSSAFVRDKTEKKEGEAMADNIVSLHTLSLSYGKIRQILKEEKLKSFGSIFWLCFFSFLYLLGLLFFIFFVGYILHYFKKVFGEETLIPSNSATLIIFGIFWFVLFADLLLRNLKINKDFVYPMWFLMTVFFFLGIIKVKNHDLADSIMKGSTNVQYEMEYQNQIISTSNDLKYIGKTEKYIFLKEIKTGGNIIYPTDRVGRMEFINLNNTIEKTIEKTDSATINNQQSINH